MERNIYMRFPDWKAKAVTLSYDDATKADVRLIKLMREYGLKGTINVNSGLYSCYNRLSKEDAYKLYIDSGMEIAAHGLTHSRVTLPSVRLIDEIVIDKKNLENEYGRIIRGFAYPDGVVTERAKSVLNEIGFAYARTSASTNSFAVPNEDFDWFKWTPTCRHSATNFNELVRKFIDSKPENAYNKSSMLFYLFGHSYEFDNNDNWALIENFAKEISQCSDVWNATNIEVCDYVKAYHALCFSADCEKVLNNSVVDVYLLVDGKQVLAKAGQVTEI